MRPPSSLATLLAATVLIFSVLGLLLLSSDDQVDTPLQQNVEELQTEQSANDGTFPELREEILVTGLTRPWDIAFLPNGDFIVNERGASMTRFSSSGTTRAAISGLPEIFVQGEGGLLGLAIDPEFISNSYVYACYNTREDIRISRWILSNDELQDGVDIVEGMPVNTTTFPGRHSGCRLQFDQQGYLWIGTGDVAVSSHPQDPQSLGGKILRVDRDGNPLQGNLGAPFDPRIYSYGHRNVQGLALAREDESFIGFSVQHGPRIDDEVNLLAPGNFAWDPGPNYNENVPMTDLETFPDAVEAVWSSGNPTLAPSGADLVYGDEWGAYSGNLLVAMQKTMHLRMFEVNDDGSLGAETELYKNEYGRLRTVRQAPDRSLYLLTDNGNGEDQVIRITPVASE